MDIIIHSKIKFKRYKNSKYYISKCGKIYSSINTIIMSTHYNRHGYEMVGFNMRLHSIHRLVAKTFIPNPNKKRIVNHIDGNKQNNNVENLEWCTDSENVRHSYSLGLQIPKIGKEHHNSKTVYQMKLNGEYVKEWGSLMDIQRELGFNIGHISAVCNGIRHKANGFIWSHDMHKFNTFNSKCYICSKSFTKNTSEQKYCSEECRSKAYYHPRELKKNCIVCNKEFVTTRKNAICCSEECKSERKLIKNRELYAKKHL